MLDYYCGPNPGLFRSSGSFVIERSPRSLFQPGLRFQSPASETHRNVIRLEADKMLLIIYSTNEVTGIGIQRQIFCAV
jgi:hypothetical protein